MNIQVYIPVIFSMFFKILILFVPLLVSVAYLTLLERKVIALVQYRKGPNVAGFFGMLQPWADALKLMFKEIIIPESADKFLFLLAPAITFVLAIVGWAVIPINKDFVLADLNVGVLYLLAISSLGIYGIVIAGWASNSKYSFLGSIRSVSQMISYELSIGLAILSVVMLSSSFNLTDIILAQKNHWFIIPLFPLFVTFFISTLAETNRHPFDLPEAEAELVSGYNVEYSSMPFALFFLGEYANMILMSAFTAILFLGGWLPPFSFLSFIPGTIWFISKIAVLLLFFILIRAAIPRYRYDQLMKIGWKIFLPLNLLWLVVVAGYIVYF